MTLKRMTAFLPLSVGSLTAALVHPREVFKPAILANEDNAVTSRLRQAGELLEIKVLDHVISESEKPPSFLTDALHDPPGCVTG